MPRLAPHEIGRTGARSHDNGPSIAYGAAGILQGIPFDPPVRPTMVLMVGRTGGSNGWVELSWDEGAVSLACGLLARLSRRLDLQADLHLIAHQHAASL